MYISGQAACEISNKILHKQQNSPGAALPSPSSRSPLTHKAKHSPAANQVRELLFLDYDTPPSAGGEDGAYITSDPANALIERGECV